MHARSSSAKMHRLGAPALSLEHAPASAHVRFPAVRASPAKALPKRRCGPCGLQTVVVSCLFLVLLLHSNPPPLLPCTIAKGRALERDCKHTGGRNTPTNNNNNNSEKKGENRYLVISN